MHTQAYGASGEDKGDRLPTKGAPSMYLSRQGSIPLRWAGLTREDVVT